MIDFEFDGVTGLEASGFDLADMDEQIAEFLLRIGDAKERAFRPLDDAGVADLPAAFAIERRLVEDKRAVLAGLQLRHLLAARYERRDDAFRGFGIVAEELRGAGLVLDLEPQPFRRRFAGALPGGLRGFLLLFHRGLERCRVDRDAARFQARLR